jgi:cytochrome P450
MKEVLRLRPPATMVPHMAMEDFKLTDTFTAPKGSLVIPSVYESAFQGWTNPHQVRVLSFYFFIITFSNFDAGTLV